MVDAPIGRTNKGPARNRTQHESPGSVVLRAMRFMLWAQEQHTFPTRDQVMTRFGCCKATAYRWIGALREVYGLPPLREAADA